jgi:hypothetical protein
MGKRMTRVATLLLLAGGALWGQPAPDQTDSQRNRLLYGYATMSPAGSVVAGAWGAWTLTYSSSRSS